MSIHFALIFLYQTGFRLQIALNVLAAEHPHPPTPQFDLYSRIRLTMHPLKLNPRSAAALLVIKRADVPYVLNKFYNFDDNLKFTIDTFKNCATFP